MAETSGHWAKPEEEDRVETLIRQSGCWDGHMGVVNCMSEKGDWRECQAQMADDFMCQFEPYEQDELIVNKNNIWPTSFTPFNELENNNLLKALQLFHKDDFQGSYDLIAKELESGNHISQYYVILYDSLLRSALRIENFYVDKLVPLLREYENHVHCYGDQLQYFNVAAQVYAKIDSPETIDAFLKYVSLLCSTVNLPEHWLLFGKNPFIKDEKFEHGYLTGALNAFRQVIKNSQGFVKEIAIRKYEELQKRLPDGEEGRESRDYKHSHEHEKDENTDDLTQAAHDCRSKVDKLKTKEDIEEIYQSLRKRYSSMFENL